MSYENYKYDDNIYEYSMYIGTINNIHVGKLFVK